MNFNYGIGIETETQKGVADVVYNVMILNPRSNYPVEDISEIGLDSDFRNGLGFDRFDIADIWMRSGKKFGIKVNYHDVHRLNSVGELSEYIEERRKK